MKKFILNNPLLMYIFQKLFPVSGAILMFHRVRELKKRAICYNDHLSVSPDFFDTLLMSAKKAGYSFVSLDELVELIEKKKRFSKVLALTFDDGYKDNLVNALPVMEQYNAPGTIFCATGLMTGEFPLWWDLLEEYILSDDTVKTVRRIPQTARTTGEKEQLFLSIRQELLLLTAEEQENYFFHSGYLPETLKDRFNEEMISKEMLETYRDSKLVSFGSHTHSHLSCGALDRENFAAELTHSLKILRSCGVDIKHFAYPYGDDVKDPEKFREIFQENGIKSCCTTLQGFVSSGTDPLFLPRFFVSEYDNFTVKKNLFQAQLMHLKKKVSSGI